MFRTLTALSLSLALAALSGVTTNCGSSNRAQIRVINAIPDSGPTDIRVNGTRIVPGLEFGEVQPSTSPASYFAVPSGGDIIQGFEPGDTTNPISPVGTFNLNGSTQYTLVAVGLELNDEPPLLLTDNNRAPTSGNVEFRIVNASLNSPANGVDVYFVPPGTNITSYTPQITALGQGQGSAYVRVPFINGGYAVVITATAKKTALITQPSAAPSGSITTMVIVDNAGGSNGMSQTPLVLNDLN
ncbi:MAG TPA: DUF4397 domain-containing protein [Terriglobales bacterium]|nr:DUF4397 domain-containing protein [Terriglobales bacterium]